MDIRNKKQPVFFEIFDFAQMRSRLSAGALAFTFFASTFSVRANEYEVSYESNTPPSGGRPGALPQLDSTPEDILLSSEPPAVSVVIAPSSDNDESKQAFANKCRTLFDRFDKDLDERLDFTEAQALQQATSPGVEMSSAGFDVALRMSSETEPSRGMGFAAFMNTYLPPLSQVFQTDLDRDLAGLREKGEL